MNADLNHCIFELSCFDQTLGFTDNSHMPGSQHSDSVWCLDETIDGESEAQSWNTPEVRQGQTYYSIGADLRACGRI